MRMFLLSSDDDTLTGFRLAGVAGERIDSEDRLIEAFQSVREDKTIGIVLVTRSLSAFYPDVVLEQKKRTGLLITEIPDMKDPTAKTDSITAYVRDAVGINV